VNASSNFQTHQTPNADSLCYKCRKVGHWARDCHSTQFNLIDFDPTKEPISKDRQMTIEEMKTAINTISTNNKGKLANEMGVGEDFLTACLTH